MRKFIIIPCIRNGKSRIRERSEGSPGRSAVVLVHAHREVGVFTQAAFDHYLGQGIAAAVAPSGERLSLIIGKITSALGRLPKIADQGDIGERNDGTGVGGLDDAGHVGALAGVPAAQRLDLVAVVVQVSGHAGVGVGGVGVAGVGRQGGQLGAALGAQDLVPGHGTGVLGGGGPAQRHPAALGGLGGQAAGGQGLGRGRRLVGTGGVLGVVVGQVDAGVVGHLALLAVPERLDPIGVAHPRLVGGVIGVAGFGVPGVGH